MFPSAAHMTSRFRTPPPRPAPPHACRQAYCKDIFRHPTITLTIENQCMHAQEQQMLWSKDLLDGIVLSAVCNLEKVQAPIVTKEG